ncbi:MAG: redoxin domain-containing protein [Clostridiales bacterium]|nr:redoxin domain-containing protein [Clostridiales bacterium]
MKKLKRSSLIVALVLCFVTLCLGVFSACDDDEDGINYSVTVELPDGSGASGVTVSFGLNGKDYGSVVTGEDGKAEKRLDSNVYDVTLSNLPEGYEFTETAQTNRLGSPLLLTLSAKTLDYSVTVTLPNGATAPLSGIQVTWRNGAKDVADAVTNENGVATATLPAGDYNIVLEDVPEGYWLETSLTATAANSAVTANLAVDTRVKFTVNAKTEGGMNVRNVHFFVLKGADTAYEGTTNADGEASFRLLPDNYTLVTASAIAGLTPEKTSYSLNEENSSVTILFSSKIIDEEIPNRKTYVLGDIMYDFTYTTYNGAQTVTLSDLLKTKKAVVLNFWYTTCTYCIQEFPCLEEAYEEYKDDVEVIGINPLNDSITIANFLTTYAGNFQLTFPITRDTAGLSNHFVINGYPTTVIIDRYGAVAFIEAGGIVETELWTLLFEKYTADDYTQDFTPGEEISPPEEFVPDEVTETMTPTAQIEAAINHESFNFSYYPEEGTKDAEYSWPWILGEKNGQQALKPSNGEHRASYAIVHTDMTLQAGDVVAFDYFTSTELRADIVYVMIDGLVMWQISGLATDWQTCYAYVALKAGTYTMTLIYQKDATKNQGDDAVYIRNVRIVSENAIEGTVDIMRHCATEPNEGLTSYHDYVTPVMGTDNYYHVGKPDGPYILADLLHGTQWNNKSFYELVMKAQEEGSKFQYDLNKDGVKENCADLINEYLNLATKSDSYGLVPVSAELKALLDCFTKEYSENHHEQEWLELCKYISRYGESGEYPLPTMGLREDMAFTAVEGTNNFTINRPILPVGMLTYKFVPEHTGVYRFHSTADTSNESNQTQAWLYGAAGTKGTPLAYNGDDLFGTTPDDDGTNFTLYGVLTAGETYYLQCAFYWGDVLGSFDFEIEYIGTYHTAITACAPGYFTSKLDANGNMTGEPILNSIATVKDGGKYYAKNADGSKGSVIMIDFKKPTRAHPLMSLESIIESWIFANDGSGDKFHPFDFSHDIQYVVDENNELIDDGTGSPLSHMVTVPKGVDYTQTMRDYLASADENGYVEATETLVNILKTYCNLYSFKVDNAWLQFAYYEKEYGTKP